MVAYLSDHFFVYQGGILDNENVQTNPTEKRALLMEKNILTLAQMIVALGCEEVDSEITENHFPILPRNREDYDLGTICYPEFMTTRAIMENLVAQGLTAGDIADLCEYGAKNPDEQKEHSINEIASIWDGDTERHRFLAALTARNKVDPKSLRPYKARVLALYHDGGHFPGTHILVRRPR